MSIGTPTVFSLSLILIAASLQAAGDIETKQAEPPSAAAAGSQSSLDSIKGLPILTIKDGHFRNSADEIIRFWGVNLASVYPDHAQADGLARELASRQINLVRPHHLARASKDWNPEMTSGAILTYQETSREFDPVALDRFDYLNSALRSHGIYLAMSAHQTRQFLPGDVGIQKTTLEDEAAWSAAIKEMHTWPWQKSFDLWKSLPTFDERAALLAEEFLRKQLTHVNPYTELAYANDPQVLTLETINESCIEYMIICKGKYPDYLQAKLVEKWNAACREAGLEPSDLYDVASSAHKDLRAKFLRGLDEKYMQRMRKVVAATGSKVPLTFSNLWRGDNTAAMHYQNADWVENHGYIDPDVTAKADDGILPISYNAVVGRPFFVGELNQAEGADNIKKQAPYRTMLMPAMASYGSLQNWDGLVWFAWSHGSKPFGPDGRTLAPSRTSHLGEMASDTMMQDHMRTMGLVFRKGLVKPSKTPLTLWIDEPYTVGDYHGLVRGKANFKPGWQNVHALRKAYGPVPADQASAEWLKTSPQNPLISDTGEIVKDTVRKQLTIAAPQVEIISGRLDGAAPQGPSHLAIDGNGEFVTVAVVALDDLPLSESRHLLLSRTVIAPDGNELPGLPVQLKGLTTGKIWQLSITRPEGQSAGTLTPTDGVLKLPSDGWNECELILEKPVASR